MHIIESFLWSKLGAFLMAIYHEKKRRWYSDFSINRKCTCLAPLNYSYYCHFWSKTLILRKQNAYPGTQQNWNIEILRLFSQVFFALNFVKFLKKALGIWLSFDNLWKEGVFFRNVFWSFLVIFPGIWGFLVHIYEIQFLWEKTRKVDFKSHKLEKNVNYLRFLTKKRWKYPFFWSFLSCFSWNFAFFALFIPNIDASPNFYKFIRHSRLQGFIRKLRFFWWSRVR